MCAALQAPLLPIPRGAPLPASPQAKEGARRRFGHPRDIERQGSPRHATSQPPGKAGGTARAGRPASRVYLGEKLEQQGVAGGKRHKVAHADVGDEEEAQRVQAGQAGLGGLLGGRGRGGGRRRGVAAGRRRRSGAEAGLGRGAEEGHVARAGRCQGRLRRTSRPALRGGAWPARERRWKPRAGCSTVQPLAHARPWGTLRAQTSAQHTWRSAVRCCRSGAPRTGVAARLRRSDSLRAARAGAAARPAVQVSAICLSARTAPQLLSTLGRPRRHTLGRQRGQAQP